MIDVKEISKSYASTGTLFGTGKIKAVEQVSFSIAKGDCMGLIGESGSGKSTLGRMILGLENPDCGSVTIEGEPLRQWAKKNRGRMSVVFQDYTSSVNPRYLVKEIIAEPLFAQGMKKDWENKVRGLLKHVELSDKVLERYPHELSGGQLQRICIARAVSTNPSFLLLDEAISSLDVSVQAQVLNLIEHIKEEFNLTLLFIAHDLQAVTKLCNHILFMYKGQIVEQIDTSKLYTTSNEYAKKLLSSVIYFDNKSYSST